MTATQQYDAFGLLVASSGTQVGPFGFVGKEGYQTDASGLMLLGHRYYDPSTGRFLTRDPAKFGKNWYGYCDNRPLCLADSAGLDWGPRWKKAPPILSAALAGGLYMLAIEGSVGLMLCALASALFAGGILLIRRKTADAPE